MEGCPAQLRAPAPSMHTHTRTAQGRCSARRGLFTQPRFLQRLARGFPSALPAGTLPFPQQAASAPGRVDPQPKDRAAGSRTTREAGAQLKGALAAPRFLEPSVASPPGTKSRVPAPACPLKLAHLVLRALNMRDSSAALLLALQKDRGSSSHALKSLLLGGR